MLHPTPITELWIWYWHASSKQTYKMFYVTHKDPTFTSVMEMLSKIDLPSFFKQARRNSYCKINIKNNVIYSLPNEYTTVFCH